MEKKMNWKQLLCTRTTDDRVPAAHSYEQRSQFTRDYDRLVFSNPFRRMQNKTQVFPLPGSVSVHNRLTHSLEVSCVGRSLGNDVANHLLERHPDIPLLSSIGSIVSAACLAHDLGNPPFGHNGEKSISSYFTDGPGKRFQASLTATQWNDITHFDGNANAFHLLTHNFRGRINGNYGLTYSTLAATVKYPYSSDLAGAKSKFGFFQSDESTYSMIAQQLGILPISTSPLGYVRYPLVYLVEAADDICYQIMDIEDAFKLKILSQYETENLLLAFFSSDFTKEYHDRIKASMSFDVNSQIEYLRGEVIRLLEYACADCFIRNEDNILSGKFTGTLITNLDSKLSSAYQNCAAVAQNKIYKYRDSVNVSIAGCRIISLLLDGFIKAAEQPENIHASQLLRNISSQYETDSPDIYSRIQAIIDFISNMTDVYAVSLYKTLLYNL